ncbi:MAG: hypothetical protein RIA69_17350 [Cyclobacteriaceae bacterium]
MTKIALLSHLTFCIGGTYPQLSKERSAAAVEIPKSNGKTRLLGVPTVVDRWLQQAVSQQLAAKFEAVRRCDRVRGRKLWVQTAKEHPKGSTAKLEIHQ